MPIDIDDPHKGHPILSPYNAAVQRQSMAVQWQYSGSPVAVQWQSMAVDGSPVAVHDSTMAVHGSPVAVHGSTVAVQWQYSGSPWQYSGSPVAVQWQYFFTGYHPITWSWHVHLSYICRSNFDQ